MKGGHHIKFTQYFKILTLNRGERSFYFLFLFNNKIPLDSSWYVLAVILDAYILTLKIVITFYFICNILRL